MSSPDILKDLLIEDYRYRAEALKSSEQTGETRLNIYLGILTLSLSATITLGLSKEDIVSRSNLKLFVLIILAVLFALGLMMLFRLLIRNERTDECKRDLDRIRQTFKDYFDADGLLIGYYPVGGPKLGLKQPLGAEPNNSRSKRRFGGLAHMMLVMNSLLVAGFFVSLFLPFDASLDVFSRPVGSSVLAALIAFAGAFYVQKRWVDDREYQVRRALQEQQETHAGGVIFRHEGQIRKYLLVQSKNPEDSDWVLPKGHIESGEGHIEAAIREIKEEACVLVRPLCPLDIVRYELPGAKPAFVRAKYYLMEYLFDLPGAEDFCEKRLKKWMPYEEAIATISHPEGKYLLQLAHSQWCHGENTRVPAQH